MAPAWGEDGGGSLRGERPGPAPAAARCSRAAPSRLPPPRDLGAPQPLSRLSRLSRATRGYGTGTGGLRPRPDAGHASRGSRTEPVPFLPAPREAKVEGEGAVGGGSGAALELFRGSWEAWAGWGCGEWAAGRPCWASSLAVRPFALGLPEGGRKGRGDTYNDGYGNVKFPRYPCGCDTDEGSGAGEKGCFPVLDQPLRALEELPFGHGCGSGACAWSAPRLPAPPLP